MKNRFSPILMLAIGSMLSAGAAFGQTASGLSGRVTDSQGAIVTGATVRLYAGQTGTRATTATDADGGYRFERVPAGDYVVEAEARGFGRISRSIHIGPGALVTQDLTLATAGPSETVLVTAAGTPQTVDEVSKALSVVSAQEIERRGEYSIGEALRTVPGLRIQQLGGPGAFTRIQSRGLRDSDTAILIDGMRLRDPASTQGDATSFIEELFTVNSDRIEVLRGSGSSLYGTHAIGGVVNVISDQGGAPTHGQLELEGGQLGLFHGRAQLAGGMNENRIVYSGGLALLNVSDGLNHTPTRSLSGQSFVQYNFSPKISLSSRIFGNTAFLQQPDSPYALPLDETAFPRGSIVKAVALPMEQQRRLEAGLPVQTGNANFVPNLRDPDSRRDSDFMALAFTFNQSLSDSFSYRANYQRVNTNRQFSDGALGARFEPFFDSISNFDGRLDVFNLQANARLGRYSLLSAGYEFERERYLGRERDRNPVPAARVDNGIDVAEQSHAFFVQNQWRALEKRLQVSAALRLQSFDLGRPGFFGGVSVFSGLRFEAPKTAYTGDGSISYFFASSGTKLRAHVGNGYRAPSLFERFGSSFFEGSFTAFGDPRLRPERSIAVDAGIDQRLARDRVQLSATYFYTRLQEVVIFDSDTVRPDTDPFGRFGGYRNSGGGLARGVELSVAAQPHRTLDLSASYTFTNSVNRVPVQVPGFLQTFVQPRHLFTLAAAQQVTRRLDVIFDLFAYGSYYFPLSGTGRAFKFGGPVKADLGASYTLPVSDRTALRFHGKIENLFDREYFESGFRTPGAVFTGGLSLRF
ncbi:MAG TPA: TonB-dependent receptor [Blastocatellia bacterium]|nr:TonB-dependent receptor [Blastocatellia bacterium]